MKMKSTCWLIGLKAGGFIGPFDTSGEMVRFAELNAGRLGKTQFHLCERPEFYQEWANKDNGNVIKLVSPS